MFRTRMLLVAIALVAAGCGASRGVRIERADVATVAVGGSASGTGLHVISTTIVSAAPGPLATDGDTLWVSTVGGGTPGVQSIAAVTGQPGGLMGTPYRSDLPAMVAHTSEDLWILVRPPHGRTRLLHFDTAPATARAIARSAPLAWMPEYVPYQTLRFPRRTRIVGSTRSALWLVSRDARGYGLWRRNARTGKLVRVPLASQGSPAVAVTPTRVFVLLRPGDGKGMVLQTRGADGRIAGRSVAVPTVGPLQAARLSACGTDVVGWTRSATRTAVFRLDAATGEATIRNLAPLPHPTTVTAIAFGPRCRDVWVATTTYARGAVSRYRAADLVETGTLDSSYISALIWTRGSLWASDDLHDAVIRIR
jgi:hypothetical protein